MAIVQSNPSLIGIDLSGCPNITNKTLFCIAENCKKLESISLSHCPTISDRGLQEVISKCSSLQRIDLEGYTQFTPTTIDILCQGKAKVNLSGCPTLTDKDLEKLIKNGIASTEKPLTKCPLLECQDDLIVDHLRSVIRVKRSFNFSGCENLKDQVLYRLLSEPRFFEYFNLALCKNLSDNTLALILSKLQDVTTLNLSGCSQITDGPFNEMLEERAFLNLKDVNISGCLLTERSVVGLLLKCDLT